MCCGQGPTQAGQIRLAVCSPTPSLAAVTFEMMVGEMIFATDVGVSVEIRLDQCRCRGGKRRTRSIIPLCGDANMLPESICKILRFSRVEFPINGGVSLRNPFTPRRLCLLSTVTFYRVNRYQESSRTSAHLCGTIDRSGRHNYEYYIHYPSLMALGTLAVRR